MKWDILYELQNQKNRFFSKLPFGPLLRTFYTYKINNLPSNRRENDGICQKNDGYDLKSVRFIKFLKS